jgi:hypothetical protein
MNSGKHSLSVQQIHLILSQPTAVYHTITAGCAGCTVHASQELYISFHGIAIDNLAATRRPTNLDVAAASLLARAAHWAEQEVKRKRRPWAADLQQQHHKREDAAAAAMRDNPAQAAADNALAAELPQGTTEG